MYFLALYATTWHMYVLTDMVVWTSCDSPNVLLCIYNLRTPSVLVINERNEYKTASFQKEAMRTHVALWLLWSEICIEKFLCVWINKTSENISWEKSTALKDSDQKEMIGFNCICL